MGWRDVQREGVRREKGGERGREGGVERCAERGCAERGWNGGWERVEKEGGERGREGGVERCAERGMEREDMQREGGMGAGRGWRKKGERGAEKESGKMGAPVQTTLPNARVSHVYIVILILYTNI